MLSREEFKNAVFLRDQYRCVHCGSPAEDAHHIMERRLFTHPSEHGGYFINNGASLCDKEGVGCHNLAEQTILTTTYLREKCGIRHVVLPLHLDRDLEYDKWGNIIRPDGMRYPGDLFWDASVQSILRMAGVLDRFIMRYRYPRTMHLPTSQSISDDDKIVSPKASIYFAKDVIATVKLDGESTTIYADGTVHARSPESVSHPSQSWVRNLASRIAHEIDPGFRICGENMYAKHTIHYQGLLSYFYIHSIWNSVNERLSWDDTEFWSEALAIPTVPVFYRGKFDLCSIHNAYQDYLDGTDQEHEGYVISNASGFKYDQFRDNVVKWVRNDHYSSATRDWRRRWYDSAEHRNHLSSPLMFN